MRRRLFVLRTWTTALLYLNRELALLSFQRRVLEEAQDPTNPLLERVKFLAILGSNLDEFFMVRVAGLYAQVDAGILDDGPDGMSPAAQLDRDPPRSQALLVGRAQCLATDLLPALEEAGIHILDYAKPGRAQQAAHRRRYFARRYFPF